MAELYFWDNKLTTPPPEIGQITKLKTLMLKGNPLTDIPDSIFALLNLDEDSRGLLARYRVKKQTSAYTPNEFDDPDVRSKIEVN